MRRRLKLCLVSSRAELLSWWQVPVSSSSRPSLQGTKPWPVPAPASFRSYPVCVRADAISHAVSITSSTSSSSPLCDRLQLLQLLLTATAIVTTTAATATTAATTWVARLLAPGSFHWFEGVKCWGFSELLESVVKPSSKELITWVYGDDE